MTCGIVCIFAGLLNRQLGFGLFGGDGKYEIRGAHGQRDGGNRLLFHGQLLG